MRKTNSLAAKHLVKNKPQARQITLTKGFSGISLQKNQSSNIQNDQPKFMSPKKMGAPPNNTFHNEDTNATQFIQPMRVSASYENQKFKPSVKTKSAKTGANFPQVSPAGQLLLEEMRKRDSENKERSRNQEAIPSSSPSLYAANNETFRVLRKKQSTVSNEQNRGQGTQMSVKSSMSSIKPIHMNQSKSSTLKFQKKREIKQIDKFNKINEMCIQNSGLSQLSMNDSKWDLLKKQKSHHGNYFINPYAPKANANQMESYNQMSKNFSDKSLSIQALMHGYQQCPYHLRGNPMNQKGNQMQATGSIFGNMRNEAPPLMKNQQSFTKMSSRTSMQKGKSSVKTIKKSNRSMMSESAELPSIYDLYQVPQYPQQNIPRALDQTYNQRMGPASNPYMWHQGPMNVCPHPQHPLNHGSFFRQAPHPPIQQQLAIPEETPQRIPIQSLYPNLGYDYVYYKQADRIQKMRQKRRENNTLYSRLPGMVSGQIITNPKRKKIASRQKKAQERKRDPKGRFYSKKELEELREQEKDQITNEEDQIENEE